MGGPGSQAATALIAALATAGVILRPRGLPEAIWAVSGAVLLVVLGLLPPARAWHGIAAGLDVYLFLFGMMLLSEVARETGLFDWLAALATRLSNGSPTRLFALIYGVGTIVTVFLSNDATAVVLTPAVAASMRAARVSEPLPYLFICAFIANAASFVLPISNPANLVLYGSAMPPLFAWLPRFILPSLASITVTYVLLRTSQIKFLRLETIHRLEMPALSAGGRAAAAGIVVTAAVLMTVSALGLQLGLPTAIAGGVTAAITLAVGRASPATVLKGISWGVLPLVAGLFVLVEAIDHAGLVPALGRALGQAVATSAEATAWIAAVAVAFSCNILNNLPAGLIAATTFRGAEVPEFVRRFVLIGIDLGPNLSVTGSLATILWLAALKREGHAVSALAFLRIGAIVMPPALAAALAAAWLSG